ncbi:MAG: RNA polymerase factor sigma-54 [Proteobacteria bacterium]|nr:RNA polymerase factor sigma-54 [Pseudomonadota bacterium]MCL2306822.1 RNA polymerase factor sigma-54 [Pseudomonadota bacterium]
MKQTLNLKTSQQLSLSMQLQQAIRLLQLSTLELNEEIERVLEDNPLLEKDTDNGENAFETSLDVPDVSGTTVVSSSDETGSADTYDDARAPNDFETPGSPEKEDFILTSDEGGIGAVDDEHAFQYAASTSLRDHLLSQLALTPADDSIRIITEALIDELDDNGYLTTTFEAFRKCFSSPKSLKRKQFDTALRLLQDFDPVGVGARTPGECLMLQLRALPDSAAQRTALIIVEQHLPLLAAHDFTRLKKVTGLREELLRDACALILRLNPKPGRAFDNDRTSAIIPDIVVRKQGHRWVAQLNDAAIPKIRINAIYAEMLSRKNIGHSMWSERLQEARWLVRSIQQRFDTILRVAQAIVERQQRFFDHGAVAMRPMVLKDISDLLEMHESTISRVTTQKYMLTPQGTVEFKYFFGSHLVTSSGGAASSTAIRALIKKIIEAESPAAPLSDQQITELLDKEGIMVARRTVAKYREALSIPNALQRKDF